MACNHGTQLRRVKAMRILMLACGFVALIAATCYAGFDAQPFNAQPKKARLYSPEVKPITIVQGGEVYQYPPYARGEKGRKYVRYFSLVLKLTGDKLAAFETYGYTPHRLRTYSFGKVTERWLYYSLGLELTFDENDALISQKTFPPQSGHID
jgi:hypothetical protein